jgi:hypothetical protein
MLQGKPKGIAGLQTGFLTLCEALYNLFEIRKKRKREREKKEGGKTKLGRLILKFDFG